MQQSSSSIGSLAAALAKAQIELVNPEKSMVGTIRADGKSGGGEQIFHYAPLSSGLDIVRKILGKHEIAAVQATAIDHEAIRPGCATRPENGYRLKTWQARNPWVESAPMPAS